MHRAAASEVALGARANDRAETMQTHTRVPNAIIFYFMQKIEKKTSTAVFPNAIFNALQDTCREKFPSLSEKLAEC